MKNRFIPIEVVEVLLLHGCEHGPQLRTDVRTERGQHDDCAAQSMLKFYKKVKIHDFSGE